MDAQWRTDPYRLASITRDPNLASAIVTSVAVVKSRTDRDDGLIGSLGYDVR